MLSIRFLLIIEKAIYKDFTKGSKVNSEVRSNGFPKGIASLVSLQNQRSTTLLDWGGSAFLSVNHFP